MKDTEQIPADSRSGLIERLLETLSLVESYNAQEPPDPMARTALQHVVRDLILELTALDSSSSPSSRTDSPDPVRMPLMKPL